jgi:SAM-dependent methyltransferase
MMSKEEVKEVWQEYWVKNRDGNLRFDEMSSAIFSELLRNCGDMRGKKVLEAGCGRGIISAKLAELGADVHLLDISPEALQIARKHFASKKIAASFTEGDILGPPFGESTFDIVWNAGVMEHFEGALQLKATRGIADIVKPGGLFITFNPSARAFFYTHGKRAAERKGKWPYGPEFPVESLQGQCAAAGLTVKKEYPICFRENLYYLSYVSKHLRSIVKLLLLPFPQRHLVKVFGGYLLVTVARREKR